MRTLRWGAVAIVVGALSALTPSASAEVVETANGHFLSIAVPAGVNPTAVPGFSRARATAQHQIGFSTADNLDYHNGAVMHSVAPYLIFWIPSGDNTLSGTSSALITRYFTDLAADSGGSQNVFGVDRQFFDSTGFADYKQTFSSSQVFLDTQPYPPTDTTNCVNTLPDPPGNPCVTDTQIQAEVQRLIHVNGWPEDGNSSSVLPANAPLYFVVFPPDVNTCSDASTCADEIFCAYHSSSFDGTTGNVVLYSDIPTYLAQHRPKGCQHDGLGPVQKPNGDQVGDVAIKYISHEFSETVTDPVFTLACGGGCGWWNSSNQQEDGDQCNATGAYDPANDVNPNAFLPTLVGTSSPTLADQLINGHQYYTQGEWSNGDSGTGGDTNCEMRPSAGTMSASLGGAPTTVVPTGTTVNFTASGSSTNGYSSVTTDFGDGTTSFDPSGSGPAASYSHAFAHAGRFTATLSLVDRVGNIAKSSTAQFTVGLPPSAAFSVSPRSAATGVPVKFTSTSSDPDSGVAIAQTAFAFGDGRTATTATTSHVYSKPGTYTVTIAVVNTLGLQSLTAHTIRIVRAKIVKIKVKKTTRTGAILSVTVNAPGKLSGGAGKSRKVSKPGTFKFTLKLSGAQLAQLASTGHVKVKIKLKPAAGKTFTKTITI